MKAFPYRFTNIMKVISYTYSRVPVADMIPIKETHTHPLFRFPGPPGDWKKACFPWRLEKGPTSECPTFAPQSYKYKEYRDQKVQAGVRQGGRRDLCSKSIVYVIHDTEVKIQIDFFDRFDRLLPTAVIYIGCLLRLINVLKAGQICKL